MIGIYDAQFVKCKRTGDLDLLGYLKPRISVGILRTHFLETLSINTREASEVQPDVTVACNQLVNGNVRAWNTNPLGMKQPEIVDTAFYFCLICHEIRQGHSSGVPLRHVVGHTGRASACR